VCGSCGLGLLLETRQDTVPSERDAFLVIDGSLLVQALARRAQTLLGVSEEDAVNRPVIELLTPADAEASGPSRFAAALARAAAAGELGTAFVRPWNTFGVRLRARIAPCGPPRAALVALEDPSARPLHAVG
jgi:PAS domain-containing protein